jgi:DNA-binding XRE family transcriptional regulator
MVQDAQAMFLTPSLCRGARGLLDWTQADLAQQALVSRSTIRDFEGGRHDLHRATAVQIVRAMEGAGVRFRDIEGEGTGIFLKKRAAEE